MSVIRVTHLACDGTQPDGTPCDAMFRGADAPAWLARQEARRIGWITGRPGGQDLCDDCAKEAR
jgi:hypothetical protein